MNCKLNEYENILSINKILDKKIKRRKIIKRQKNLIGKN